MVFGEGLRPTPLLLFFKREADGREGAICGRLARKATGVSPSDFARTGVFAENIPKLRGRTNRTYRTNRTGRRGRPFYTYTPLHPSPRRGVRSPFSVLRGAAGALLRWGARYGTLCGNSGSWWNWQTRRI